MTPELKRSELARASRHEVIGAHFQFAPRCRHVRWDQTELKRSELARDQILEPFSPPLPETPYYYYIAPMQSRVNHPPDETLKDGHV